MNSFERLCARFEATHPGYEAVFDNMQSEPGYYRVYIGRIADGIGSWYTFESLADFREWSRGVILD